MSATGARWQRVNELFHAALARVPAERDAFLSGECGADGQLRVEVQSLLAAHETQASLVPAAVGMGTRLGDYEVTSFIAAGAMGQVYRAHDTKLGRDVALKILPPAFVSDPDRRARFEREARVLASLNHPNIATIYGLVEEDGISAIALELVEGETLAERIARGKIPIPEALRIAKQIAEALETAHEQGVIHRDLKPANIKLTRDDTVKVLDLGLAKLAESTTAAEGSPTLTSAGLVTSAHAVLGTPAYMSPEQARAQSVDKRTDIWAFGCVFFEMLSSRRPFEGDDVADTVAAVLRNEPDWSVLPDDASAVGTLLRRCLQKDPRRRLHSIADARFHIEDALVGALDAPFMSGATRGPTRAYSRIALAVAVGAILGAAAVGAYLSTTAAAPPVPRVTRFAYVLPDGQRFSNNNRQTIAISPDGTHMVYVADLRLYLRSMSEMESRAMPGTDIAIGPTFSPDGQFVAFWSGVDRTLKKIGIDGTTPVTLCAIDNPSGMSWDADGIVFGQSGLGILRVSALGGKPQLLVPIKRDELVYGPQVLPGGEAVLFSLAKAADGDAAWEKAQIIVRSLKSEEQKKLIDAGSDARYVPDGHLVYAAGGTLLTAAFDVRRLQLLGGSMPVVDGVRRSPTGAAHFSISNNGSLIYVPGIGSTEAAARGLALMDRDGRLDPLKLPPGPYESPRVSPDGARIAVGITDAKDANIWIAELSGTAAPRRLTFGGRNRFPMWSSDGQWVAFQSDREGDVAVFWQRADGTAPAERLTKSQPGESHIPNAWSPDGRQFLYSVIKGGEVSLWIWSVRDKSAMPFGDVHSILPINAVFSPDGRWVAYQAGQVFNNAVYVQPYPATGAKYQISKGNAHHPVWSRDGSELFYQPARTRPVVVHITTRPSFAFSDPAPLPMVWAEGGPTSIRNVDTAPDGKAIGVVPFDQSTQPPQIQVVLNWFEELKRQAPTH